MSNDSKTTYPIFGVSLLLGLSLLASACSYRGGLRTTYRPGEGYSWLAEGRGGPVLAASQSNGEPGRAQGFIWAPEFAGGVGRDASGGTRGDVAFSLPAYRYMDGGWGGLVMLEFLQSFRSTDGAHSFGPQLRIGLMREISHSGNKTNLGYVDLTAGYLFGDIDNWTIGLSTGFGVTDLLDDDTMLH